MNTLIADLLLRASLNHLMLLDQPLTFKRWRHDEHLPVVSASCEILHFDGRTRKRLFQSAFDLFRSDHKRILPT